MELHSGDDHKEPASPISHVLNAAAIVAGALAGTLAANETHNSVTRVVGIGVAATSSLLLLWTNVVQVLIRTRRHQRLSEQKEALRLSDLLAEVLTGPPTEVPSIDPVRLGVFPSFMAARASTQPHPPYVPRDIDQQLDVAILEATHAGGLIVVRGDPKSGKSRTLFEAFRRTAPHRKVYAVRQPVLSNNPKRQCPLHHFSEGNIELRGRDSVIWLDDIHEHFGRGLHDDTLNRLLERYPGILLAATVHQDKLDLFSVQDGSFNVRRQLRQASDHAVLNIRLTPRELAIAEQLYPGLTDYSEAERLAAHLAGVDLLTIRYTEHRVSQPYGIAVARAAIDWRRCGMPKGISRSHLYELSRIEARELPVELPLDAETFGGALAWACTQVAPWVSLIRPLDHSADGTFEDFDAITTMAPVVDGPVSAAVWKYVASACNRDERALVGQRASYAGYPELAEEIWRVDDDRKSESNFWSWFGLGVALEGEERDEDAELAYRRSVRVAPSELEAVGRVNLAGLLHRRGRDLEAERELDTAIAADHPRWAPSAQLDLADLKRDGGLVAEARQLYEEVTVCAELDLRSIAFTRLGDLERSLGNSDAASEMYSSLPSEAESFRLTYAALGLAALARDRGEVAAAEAQIRHAIDSSQFKVDEVRTEDGSIFMPFYLARRLQALNFESYAIEVYEGLVSLEHPMLTPRAQFNLAHCYARAGRVREATELYRAVSEATDKVAARRARKALAATTGDDPPDDFDR